MPEVGLLFHGADGTFGPSLLTLKMDKKTRRLVESNIQSGLGVGSRENRTISQSIEDTSTDQLAAGFVVSAAGFSDGQFEFQENLPWSFLLGVSIIYSMTAISLPLAGTAAKGVKARSNDSPSVKNSSAHPTGSPIGKRLFEVLIQTGDLISGHYKVVVIQTSPNILEQVAGMFGLRTTRENPSDVHPEEDEGDEEEEDV